MHTWRTWRSRVVIGVLLVVLLAPFAMVFGAQALADRPRSTASIDVPPLPDPSPDATASLDGLVDPLPLVIRDLPDVDSRSAVAAYDRATLLDSSAGRDMFDHAWASLVVDAEYDDEMALLAAELMPDRLTAGLGYSGPATDERVQALLTYLMPVLSRDPDNAGRLSNAAVGLFLYETQLLHGVHPFTEECGVRGSGWFHYGALLLLQETDRAFVANRAVLLNLGFLTSLTANAGVGEATVPVSRLLAQDSADHTARLLLGSLVARQVQTPDALESALQTLSPFLDDDDTEALGYAALGDAYLAPALQSRGASPFLAHEQALEALRHYDLALALTTDPGIHAGRAAALDLLEAPEAAIATLERAIQHAPDAINLHTGIALLYRQVGDYTLMREHARTASDIASGAWDPHVADVRYVRVGDATSETPDPGYLGFSYGFERDHVPWRRTICMAGGGFFVSLNLFPTGDPWISDPNRLAFAPSAARDLTLSASVLLGDADGAAPDWDDWDDSRQRVVRDAANLAIGEDDSGEVDQASWTMAVRALEETRQYARASEICERFDSLSCAGVNAWLADDYARAADLLGTAAEAAIQRYTNTDRLGPYDIVGDDALAILRAADASRKAGDEARARERYTIVASRVERSPLFAGIASTKLGELALEGGEPAGALVHFDAALDLIHSRDYEDDLASALPESRAPAVQAMQVTHNNRGIARLWEARPHAEDAPECTGQYLELCRGALDDFTIALEADPANPVFLLNMGWALRLLGNDERAYEALQASASIDPTIYPALNDLGVFEARGENVSEARDAFRDAIASNPRYDLGYWNLGVLETSRGLRGLLPGQVYLAHAIDLNRSFRQADITFQTDERIYRVAFDPAVGAGFSFGQASSTAAIILGAISFVGAARVALTSSVTDTLVEQAIRHRASLSRRLPALLRRLGPRVAILATGLPSRVMAGLPDGPVRAFVANIAEPRRAERWHGPLAWGATLTILAIVTAWPLLRVDPLVRPALLLQALFAVASALVIHEAGHLLAARLVGARIRYTQWAPGIALAPLLLPLSLNSGPFMGQRVEGVSPRQASKVYLAGPVANLIAAGLMYLLFALEPLPLLRTLAQVHIGAVAYALLPFAPLDGAYLKRRRPRVTMGLALAAAVVSVLFTIGLL